MIERGGRDRLGEGPIWVPARQEVIWVDIYGQRIHRLNLETGSLAAVDVAEPIGWLAPRRDHANFVAGFKSGIAIVDIEVGTHRIMATPEPDRPNNRFNDAKVDRFGRLWAGTKNDLGDAANGALYRIGPGFRHARVDDGYIVPNGPTFSPDGRILYHSDSGTRTIFAFDITENGHLENKRVWLQFEEEWGYPDGMTTDVDGCLWVAHWGGGRVSRFDADARLVQSLPLPATNITSCTFAGDGLDRLFVTSSTIDCEHEEFAGALFELIPGAVGIAPLAFAG